MSRDVFTRAFIVGRRIERRRHVSQRNVELMIGRLVTDEAFRATFLRDPAAALRQIIEWGYELTSLEVAALVATDPGLWSRTAEHIDLRLQKVPWQKPELDILAEGVLATPEEEP
jgi:putative modified peptide